MAPSRDEDRRRVRSSHHAVAAVIASLGLLAATMMVPARASVAGKPSTAKPRASSAKRTTPSPKKATPAPSSSTPTTPIRTTPVLTTPVPTTPTPTTPAPTTSPPPPQCTPSTQSTLTGVTQAKSGYLTVLNPQTAWPVARGAGVRVALLDTGVSSALGRAGGALAGRLVDGGNFAPGTDHLGAFLDCDGQGTGDAGLIGATDSGTALPGMAPDATVVSIRVQAGADVPPTPAAVVRGLAAAMAQRAQVIVIASPCANSPALAAAIAKAEKAGALVVAAVGDPQTPTTTSYPAMYPGVIGVASSGWSAAAAAVTGKFIDLTAPGTGLATRAVSGRGYVSGQGTARSAALTGGTAALVRSAYPTSRTGTLTIRLEYSADHPAGAVPDRVSGWGVVNPYAALTLPVDRTTPPTAAPASHLGAVVLPPPDDPHHRYLGAVVAAVLLCVALAAAGALAGVRRARRRRWQVAGHD